MTKKEQQFVATVWNYYDESGRHDLPWRKTTSPYRIVVSELMLQQTQVSRVIPKYQAFLKRFPDTKTLAAASLGEVLTFWQGLGYNRRAKFLWQTAQVVETEYKGKWPRTFIGLKSLPGIGNYTAAAVMAFAYNEAVPLLETNVRTVYIHHFFSKSEKISDTELLPLVKRTLSNDNAREWYAALMDYGAHLKTTKGNLNVKSSTYKKQSTFKTSNQYVRGVIIRVLTMASASKQALFAQLHDIQSERIEIQLEALLKEGLIVAKRGRYQLP